MTIFFSEIALLLYLVLKHLVQVSWLFISSTMFSTVKSLLLGLQGYFVSLTVSF